MSIYHLSHSSGFFKKKTTGENASTVLAQLSKLEYIQPDVDKKDLLYF